MEYKKCSICNEMKSTMFDFYIHKSGPRKGLPFSECKSCTHMKYKLSKQEAKRCKTCGKIFSLDNFYKSKLTHDGYEGSCKQCRLKQMRQNRLIKKEEAATSNSYPLNTIYITKCKVCGKIFKCKSEQELNEQKMTCSECSKLGWFDRLLMILFS